MFAEPESWIRERLFEGLVIPAHPLALDEQRKLDERRQGEGYAEEMRHHLADQRQGQQPGHRQGDGLSGPAARSRRGYLLHDLAVLGRPGGHQAIVRPYLCWLRTPLEPISLKARRFLNCPYLGPINLI